MYAAPAEATRPSQEETIARADVTFFFFYLTLLEAFMNPVSKQCDIFSLEWVFLSFSFTVYWNSCPLHF